MVAVLYRLPSVKGIVYGVEKLDDLESEKLIKN
jgi:hypothetical protein